MQTTPRILTELQIALADELTALDLYTPHQGKAEAWGYGVFVTYIAERTDDERKHVQRLIKRICELGGTPDTTARNPLPEPAGDLITGLHQDRLAEMGAIAKYNHAVQIATEDGDNATRAMLEEILQDEDDHLLDIERRLVQIAQVTAPQWLSMQIG